MKRNLLFLFGALLVVCATLVIACTKEAASETANQTLQVPQATSETNERGGDEKSELCQDPCEGSVKVTSKTNDGTNDTRYKVEVFKKGVDDSSWTLVTAVNCINGGTVYFPIDHQYCYRARVGFQNLRCMDHPNWQLKAKLELFQGDRLYFISDEFQNGPGTWDFDSANNPICINCPNCPVW